MSDKIGSLSFPSQDEQRQQGYIGKKPYSKRLQHIIDQEVFKLVAQARERAEQLIKQNKDKLHLIAKELMAKETLSYEDIVRLIGKPVHEHKLTKSKATDVI
jgi:ATP-dependent Zn protease